MTFGGPQKFTKNHCQVKKKLQIIDRERKERGNMKKKELQVCEGGGGGRYNIRKIEVTNNVKKRKCERYKIGLPEEQPGGDKGLISGAGRLVHDVEVRGVEGQGGGGQT